MPQPSITKFLLARVAEREQDAASIHCDDCPAMDYDYGGMPTGPCRCGEPERVAAWCAAVRAIVELHREGGIDTARGELIGDGECSECEQFYPCSTTRVLAQVGADHADFDQAWAE